jgi:alkylhydroperoxidase family enzyme
LPEKADGETPFDQVFALRPEAAAAFQVLWDGLYDPDRLDPRLTDLCRLRVAQLVGAASEVEVRTPAAVTAGLTEDDVAALPQWPTSSRFGPAERAALCYAELFVMDPSSVTDQQAADVLEQVGAPGAAALSIALATFDSKARMCVALGV